MDLLFLMDPLGRLNPAGDTTFALMRAARVRGHRTFFADPSTLGLEGAVPIVATREVALPGASGAIFSWLDQAPVSREVASFPIVWMRKDPPFDLAYVEATWLLDRVDRGRCRVINDPTGIRGANEKLYALRFPDLVPPTIVTSDANRLRTFVDEHGEVVLKPLHGSGGAGILFASKDGRGLMALLETATGAGTLRCEAQAYLPGASRGDKRILLLDGEPLGAVMRIHGEGEERNNLHLGGHAERTTLSPEDRRIVEALATTLRADGLYFVGIDVIDGKLTEVNVTSPTGIVELEALEKIDASAKVIAWCESRSTGA